MNKFLRSIVTVAGLFLLAQPAFAGRETWEILGQIVPENATSMNVTVTGSLDTSTAAVNLDKVGGANVTLGQKPSATSIPTVIASDQPAIPISAASLPLPSGAATSADQTTGNASLSSIDGKVPAQGQAAMAASLPVALASDQTDLPANLTSVGGAPLGFGQAPMTDSLPVVLASDQTPIETSANITSVAGSPFSKGQKPSSDSLPVVLASDQSSVQTTANLSSIAGSPFSKGQKPATDSLPVVIASDQSSINTSANLVSVGGLPLNFGQSPATNSLPVVLASDQSSRSRADTYSATGDGFTVDASIVNPKSFAVQVKGTGASATTWDVRLECSLNGVEFTTVISHTNADLDGTTKASGSTLFPCRHFRSRTAGIVLGGASDIVVTILGVQ